MSETERKAAAFDVLSGMVPFRVSRVRSSECRGDVYEIIHGHTGRLVEGKTLLDAVECSVGKAEVREPAGGGAHEPKTP